LKNYFPLRGVSVMGGSAFVRHLGRSWGPEWAPDCAAPISRLGFVASERARHGSAVIVLSNGPSEEARRIVWRHAQESMSGFFHALLLPVQGESWEPPADTRAGRLDELCESGSANFNADISSWWEWPARPDVLIDPSKISILDAAASVVGLVAAHGYISPNGTMIHRNEIVDAAVSHWRKLALSVFQPSGNPSVETKGNQTCKSDDCMRLTGDEWWGELKSSKIVPRNPDRIAI